MSKYAYAPLREEKVDRVRFFQGISSAPERVNEQNTRSSFLVLIVEQNEDDSVFLYRYTNQGMYAGDTWHENIFDAYEQAQAEHPDTTFTWADIPDGVEDCVMFVLCRMQLTGP